MPIELTDFDAADYLTTEQDRLAYLNAAIEDGNTARFLDALAIVRRAERRHTPGSTVSEGTVAGDLSDIHRTLDRLGLALRIVPKGEPERA